MSLPPTRESEGWAVANLAERVRILEAKQQGSGGGFGESITVLPDTVAQDVAVIWDTPVCDPWGFWSAGQPTRFTIPTGLAGVYTFAWTAESEPGTGDWEIQRNACPWIGSAALGGANRQSYTFNGNLDEDDWIDLWTLFDPTGMNLKWFVMTRISDEWCNDGDGCE